MHDESVYLGLGSNVGNRADHLRAGLAELLGQGLDVRAVSSLYLTEPVLGPGPSDAHHPWYVNCVASVGEAPDVGRLLDLCQAVERRRGRTRRDTDAHPQPRPLDVDVLLIGDRVVDEGALQVPHPRMQQRRFVLAPLAEIAADARHPVACRTIAELLADLPEGERVWLLAPPPDLGPPPPASTPTLEGCC